MGMLSLRKSLERLEVEAQLVFLPFVPKQRVEVVSALVLITALGRAQPIRWNRRCPIPPDLHP